MTNNKKKVEISTIAVITLILILVGATYAFFKGSDASNTDTPLQVTTNTTDSLIFNVDTDITLVADMSNFTEGKGNREGVASATATLKANNKTNNATGNYYLYFDIKENGLKYTTETKTAELLLQVSGPDGLVTTIDGLDYVTVTDGKGQSISGFDITEVKDLITITSNKEITTTSEKIDKWEIKVILVNLNEDQSSNGGKKFNAKIEINKKAKSLGDVCSGKNMAKCMKENYTLDSHLLHHTAELANSAVDGSYRYSGSYDSVENYVCFGYDGDGVCPWDNMYRIIGVFDNQVKLIKADYAKSSELGTEGDFNSFYKQDNNETSKGSNALSVIGGYYWNYNNGSSTNANIWANSKLNEKNLNNTFLNRFSEEWQSKIAMHDWKVGGNEKSKIREAKAAVSYQNEIVTPAQNTTEKKKIGLMYVSDYGFSAKASNWETNLFEYDTNDIPQNNWMFNGLNEWTITPQSEVDTSAYHIDFTGRLINNPTTRNFAVRPVFYLEPNIILSSGTGTKTDPYKIEQPDIAQTCKDKNLASCLKDNYEMDSNLIHHDIAKKEQPLGAGDDSYRYAGSYESVNNYVCFGYDGTGTCPWDNMFRIIGVFGDNVKLIKADYASESELGIDKFSTISLDNYKGKLTEINPFYWSGVSTNKSNNWEESVLNTLALQNNFLNLYNTEWQNKIIMYNWQIGGNTRNSFMNVKAYEVYQNEIVNPSNQKFYKAKVGLFYISDYLFGATTEYWNYNAFYYDNTLECDGCKLDYRAASSSNWLYLGGSDWSITKQSDSQTNVMIASSLGNLSNPTSGSNAAGVRPCFFLTSDITLTGGTGTQTDPYKIN